MSFADRSALVGAASSLVIALQNLVNLEFPVKLTAIAIFAVSAVWACSSSLIRSIKTRQQPFGLSAERSSRTCLQVLGILGLLGLCALIALCAWLFIGFYTVSVTTNFDQQPDRIAIWFRAAISQADEFVIEVPRQGDIKCKPLPSSSPQRAANSVVYDWSSANPQIRISDFRYPQQQGLACSPPIKLDELILRAKPPSIEIFFPERQTEYNVVIFLIGGVLWLASALRVLLRAR
jgi:hypothetical protein